MSTYRYLHLWFIGVSLLICSACRPPANTPPIGQARQTQSATPANSPNLTLPLPSITLAPPITPSPMTATPTIRPLEPISPTPEAEPPYPAPYPPAPASTPLPPQPTLTTAPTTHPIIDSFTVDRTEINGGEALTFAWRTRNGVDIRILEQDMPYNSNWPIWRADLAASGSIRLTTNPTDINTHKFILNVTGVNGEVVSQSVAVRFRCHATWFFAPPPDFCPTEPPAVLLAAEESFEGGRMIWVALAPSIENWNAIYVLFDDGHAVAQSDTWSEAEPADDPTLVAPDGRFQPVRGFGKLWRENSWVRGKVGWALNQEFQFTTTYQRDVRRGTSWKVTNIFLTLSDGRLVQIISSYGADWRYVNP